MCGLVIGVIGVFVGVCGSVVGVIRVVVSVFGVVVEVVGVVPWRGRLSSGGPWSPVSWRVLIV